MKLEIKNLFRFPSGRYTPCGLNIYQKIWWRFVPGEIIKVKWPNGKITVDHNDPRCPRWFDCGGAVSVEFESADPNDHYRPELEALVGKQGWDWNWGMADNDVSANRLTIKIRKKHAHIASYFMLKWA
jgi:hypothetical protein